MTRNKRKKWNARRRRRHSRAALYVNYFEVGHNPFEFLIDLGQYHPGPTEADGRIAIHTRVAVAPTLRQDAVASCWRAPSRSTRPSTARSR